MAEIKELTDARQHPTVGRATPLERRIAELQQIFSWYCPSEFKDNILWFHYPHMSRFCINGIYEWNAVFLEYADGEDGDMFDIHYYDTARTFIEMERELTISSLDDFMEEQYTYRIYETECNENMTCIRFRFTAAEEKYRILYAHKKVIIDNQTYSYVLPNNSYGQAVLINHVFDSDLYDHWIQFV